MEIVIEVSARHIHLTRESIDVLFGLGFELEFKKELSQPNQFVSMQKLDVIGMKNTIKNVSVLGPERTYNQVEVSASDARNLGVDALVRLSGDIDNTPGITLVGPNGSVILEKGVVIAKRHIHLDPETAKSNQIANGQKVCVKVNNDTRALTFEDVIVRIEHSFYPAMHVDTDEANAAWVKNGDIVEIMVL